MKVLKTIFIIIGLAIFTILIAGIYKFNFTNDDVFVELENGKVVNVDSPEAKAEEEEEEKQK